MRSSVVTALLLACVPAASLAMDARMAVKPDSLKWGPAPPGLPPGADVAVVSGDPGKDNLYVIRVRVAAGYKVMPHWHPTAEHVTVLSGTAHIAMGDTFDPDKGETVTAGGFFSAEKDMHHYFWTTAPTEIQIHGLGPFAISYVNSADDPRNMTTMSTGKTPGRK